MFFATFANLLSSIPTFLFPVFASYKALKTSDPALLQPWLMYWVVLACALFFESWAGPILVWIPVYPWVRLLFLLYLILPQTQGAKVLYQTHVHPFLHDNELFIDDFISSAHDRAKATGLNYLKHLIQLIKQHVLGLPPHPPTPPPTGSGRFSYTQSLIARFNLPSARPAFPVGGAGSTATDFYTLLASAVNAATSSTKDEGGNQPRDLSNSGTLIPPSVHGADRLSFIVAQRERLSILLSGLDKEATILQQEGDGGKGLGIGVGKVPSMFFDGTDEDRGAERPRSAMSGLNKSKSEADFEKIEAESGAEEEEGRKQAKRGQSASGSWLPWSWWAKTEDVPSAEVDSAMSGEDTGRSSAIET